MEGIQRSKEKKIEKTSIGRQITIQPFDMLDYIFSFIDPGEGKQEKSNIFKIFDRTLMQYHILVSSVAPREEETVKVM